MKIKGLKKAEPAPPACLVIEGEAIKYVNGLKQGDYAVVSYAWLSAENGVVSGEVRDAYDQRRYLKMPLKIFEQLRVLPTADTKHQESAS